MPRHPSLSAAKPNIEAMPWGSQDMTLVDPFGNRLTFTNAINT